MIEKLDDQTRMVMLDAWEESEHGRAPSRVREVLAASDIADKNDADTGLPAIDAVEYDLLIARYLLSRQVELDRVRGLDVAKDDVRSPIVGAYGTKSERP